MASFTVTIENTINVFGPAEPSVWNTMVWGTDNWSTNSDSKFSIFKVLDETITLTDAVTKQATTSYSDTVSYSSDITSLSLTDAAGYQYNILGYTNLANLVETDYSSVSKPSDDFSGVAKPSTDWSDV